MKINSVEDAKLNLERILQDIRNNKPIDPETLAEAERALKRISKKMHEAVWSWETIVDALAKVYIVNIAAAAAVAKVCDEDLDRSGHLLGLVRERSKLLIPE